MSGATAPLSVFVGTALASYSLWQLVFDPFRGPLPGRAVALVVLASSVLVGLGLVAWGLDQLDLLRRP